MDMEDPNPKGNQNPNPNPALQYQSTAHHHPQSSATSFANPAVPFRGSYHRRAQSEVQFRIPDDLDLASDPFGSFEELGSEDDLFCTYMDIEKFGSRPDDGAGSSAPKSENVEGLDNGGGDGGGREKNVDENVRSRHRHSNSLDGSSILESIEAKKAMAPDKLAELWNVDPKRAKRFSLCSSDSVHVNCFLLISFDVVVYL